MRIDNINNACEVKGIVKGLKATGKFPGLSGYYEIETSKESFEKILSDPSTELGKYSAALAAPIGAIRERGWIILYGAKIYVDKRAELDKFIDWWSGLSGRILWIGNHKTIPLTDRDLLLKLVEQFRSEDSKN